MSTTPGSGHYYRQGSAASSIRTRPLMIPMTPPILDRVNALSDRSVSNYLHRSKSSLGISSNDEILTNSNGGGGGGGHAADENVAHARLYFNPARQQIYKRYSQRDWNASNSKNYNISQKERLQAERLRTDAWRAVKITDEKTRVRQMDATKRLKQRTDLIRFWKEQLVKESNLNQTETEMLIEHLRVLEMALENTKKPLHIAQECLAQREKRYGIDQVKDDVERALIKEVKIIIDCQDKMKQVIRRTNVQIRMNQAAQAELDHDAKDKSHAYYLDDKMYQMKNNSPNIGYYPGIEAYDNTVTDPNSWVKFTEENIARSMKCRGASEKLRGVIDSILRSCANDMWNQFNSVNNALNYRVQEITDTRNKLQAHLNRTVQELFDVEKTIHLLRKSIADKEAPLKVAQTRLNERTSRINVELCNDPAMKTLQREVREIQASIQNLKDELHSAENTFIRLKKTKELLESDIQMKENSLNIDQRNCLGVRRVFPMDAKNGPIYSMPLTY